MTFLSRQGEPIHNPYEILGLERGATDDDVNKAFKKLMLKLHPDKQPAGQSEEEAAKVAETFHNVMAAKSFLLDSEHMTAKRAYDSKLASLERHKNKFNIPAFDKSKQSNPASSKNNTTKERTRQPRRGSDCTDDRGPNFFKQGRKARRASCDDCSTTSQSSTSGDDVAPKPKTTTTPSPKAEKQKAEKNKRGPRHTISENVKTSRHQKSGSTIPPPPKTCKKASSFSESCNSFFTDKEPKKDIKQDKKLQGRKQSMEHKRPSLNTKPPSPNSTKPKLSIPSSTAPPRSSSPDNAEEAKKRIASSIDAITKKFKCPLTKEIITDPMTDFEGNTYEREAILKYLESHTTSPVTGAPLYACHLTANAALKERIKCTLELKKTLDTLGAAQKKELKHVTKQHAKSSKSLKEHIDTFITELNSGTPTITLSNLDNDGTTAFSYLGLKFKLEVISNSFTVSTVFAHNKRAAAISSRLVDWNKALQEIGLGGKLTFRANNGAPVFCLTRPMEPEEFKSRTLRYSIEYFLEFSIKLHNIINVSDLKSVGKVRLSV